eukprot:GABU01004087.1.p1 GENE.GABU01004087.1~~GABU01004087.1.p1  ORF type:complete len:158 (-),score=24.18 GABU01004087.1:57-530(-)
MTPQTETDICKRLTVLLCYDFVVVFYILALLFGFVWAAIGHSWIGSSSQLCRDTCPNLITWTYILIIVFWVYVGLGAAIFLLTICIQACEEGSCGCEFICGCCITCCTCGLCGSSMMQSSKQKRMNSLRETKLISKSPHHGPPWPRSSRFWQRQPTC